MDRQTVAVKVPKERSKINAGTTTRYRVACSNLYITINHDRGGMPMEVFTNLGKAGGCPSQSEAVGRLASLALRAGVEPAEVVRQMKGIRCFACVKMNGNGKDIEALSCPDATAKALEACLEQENGEERLGEEQEKPLLMDTLKDVEEKQAEIMALKSPSGIACPECGLDTVNECGCVVCKNCGYSKCG